MKKKLLILLLPLMFSATLAYSQAKEVSAEKIAYEIMPQMDKPIVIDFWADWCEPCRMYAPTFTEVAKKYGLYADFYRIDIDENEDWCRDLNINSIPTTIVIYNKDGDFLRAGGVLSKKELLKLIKDAFDLMENDNNN